MLEIFKKQKKKHMTEYYSVIGQRNNITVLSIYIIGREHLYT